MVQIVDGEAEIAIRVNAVRASEENMVVMPANIPHALQATKPFKMLFDDDSRLAADMSYGAIENDARR